MIDVAAVAVSREILRVVEPAQPERRDRPIDFRQRSGAVRRRLVDVQQAREFAGMLLLRERVVVVHRTVAAARLQHAMVDAGDIHLRQHQFRRTHQFLHADRQVLHVVVLAFERERELAEATNAEPDVGQTRPRVVVGSKQHRGFDLASVARAKSARRRTRDDFLEVLEVYGARRMTARALPVLKHVGVAIDDHLLGR